MKTLHITVAQYEHLLSYIDGYSTILNSYLFGEELTMITPSEYVQNDKNALLLESDYDSIVLIDETGEINIEKTIKEYLDI